ncbi:MAG: hypothetical protein AVDCRST_MAG64-3660, partial [uncultured Phycisphaerae bacterium]
EHDVAPNGSTSLPHPARMDLHTTGCRVRVARCVRHDLVPTCRVRVRLRREGVLGVQAGLGAPARVRTWSSGVPLFATRLAADVPLRGETLARRQSRLLRTGRLLQMRVRPQGDGRTPVPRVRHDQRQGGPDPRRRL